MVGKFFRVSSLKLVDDLVVFLVVFELALKILDAAIKLRLGIHDLKLQVADLILIVFRHFRLLFLYFSLVLVELPLRGPLLVVVLVLQAANEVCRIAHALLLLNCLSLFRDNGVGFLNDGFDFSIKGCSEGSVKGLVFLVLCVEVENDLGKLGYFLGHLVVDIGERVGHSKKR